MSAHSTSVLPAFDNDGALSRDYLLARGHCCENGCRNCPYGYLKREPVPEMGGPDPAVVNQVPKRIVSLCPSNTEIAHALGLLPRVVGVDDWSDWPAAVRSLPRVGPDLGVDINRVAALLPDLVLASLSVPGMERNVARLRQAALPHLVLDPHSIDDIWSNIREVGRVAGVASRAEELIATLQARVRHVQARVTGASYRPRLYWEWWPKPLFCPGGRNWLTEVSLIAGGESVTAATNADCAQPTPDEVLEWDPDWILLAWTGVARHKVRPDVLHRRCGWSELRAVRTGRVRVMDEGLFCRPSPRLIDGLERLAGLLHPDRFRAEGV